MKHLLIPGILIGILSLPGNVLSQLPGLEDAVSIWLFDEGSGTTAINSVSGSPDGIICGGSQWVEGVSGFRQALEFDGYDDAVEISSNPLIGAHALTVQAYIRPSTIPDYESSKIFNIGLERTTEGKDRFMLDILPSGSGWVLSHFMSIANSSSDPEDEVVASGPVHSFNEWYHVAMVFDSTSSDAVKIMHYVNHNLEHEWDYKLDLLNEGEVFIGERYQPKGDPPIRNYFQGLMDNVVLHKKALTPEEFMPKPEDITGVTDNPIDIPTAFSLEHNYPNPFNAETTIKYFLQGTSIVNLVVYNVAGQEVSILVNSEQSQGHHSVSFDAGGLPSGIYLYRLEVSGTTCGGDRRSLFSEGRKMVLAK